MTRAGALLLLSAVPAFSAPAKPKAPAPPAVAASTAAFAWASTAPLTVEAVLAHYEAMDAALVSLSARFEQSMTMKETGVTSRVEGTLAYKKPDRLRIEHARPEPQLVVADGRTSGSTAPSAEAGGAGGLPTGRTRTRPSAT